MGGFLWTFAVASVSFMLGYILCSLLIEDRITNVKRIAVKYHTVADARGDAIQRVREALGGTEGITYMWPSDDVADRVPTHIRIDVVRRALDGR